MILKSETYHFHRLDLTRQAGFIVTIHDEDGLQLASTPLLPTPATVAAAIDLLQARFCRRVVANRRHFLG